MMTHAGVEAAEDVLLGDVVVDGRLGPLLRAHAVDQLVQDVGDDLRRLSLFQVVLETNDDNNAKSV